MDFEKISIEVNTLGIPRPSEAVDGGQHAAFHSAMAQAEFLLTTGRPAVVGSFGNPNDLREAEAAWVRDTCDIVEIRLDLITGTPAAADPAIWRHLRGIPLLFTARRNDEGGARTLGPAERMNLLESVLDDAACIDIEVASLGEMNALVQILTVRKIPWIASFHDFEKLPNVSVIENILRRAKTAGAHAFKLAARLHHPTDVARLAEFQLVDHGLPVATMGMGPLAPVSRLLNAQCGSVLNYGYLGNTTTAPGQWDAALLKMAIGRLTPLSVHADCQKLLPKRDNEERD